MDDDTEYLKLPIDERCQHKVWKARLNGYEEAIKLFSTIGDEKSPEFNKYLGLIKKFVTDQNAVAQEKGVEAALVYVENAAVAGKTCSEVLSCIVAKCLGGRPKTKDKALEVILMYIEIEKQDIVQEELIKGLSNKTPKNVAACIEFLRIALRMFGAKVINIKILVKQIPKLLEDRDKNVREETKLLTVEVYRWIGAALKPQLRNLKPIQLTELEAEFVKLPNEKVVPERYLRSQQNMRVKVEQQACQDGDGDNNGECEFEYVTEVDSYDLLDPVDILSKLPKDFFDKCEAKKWQERKEAMDNLQQLTAIPKLEAGDYSEVVRILKKIIAKDTNVVVVAVAGKCLTGLANGLRKKFTPYSCLCIETILEKFKEKKQNVVLALREAIDAIYLTTTLEAISEMIITSLNNKNPSIKAETTLFLSRCFKRCTLVTLPKKLLKPLTVALIKTLNDTDPGVRDASAEALGTAMKVVTEKIMMPFIQEVDNLKQAKIKECYDKTELLFIKPVKSISSTTAPSEGNFKKPSASSENIKKIANEKKVTADSQSTKVIQGGPPKKRPNTVPQLKNKIVAKKNSAPAVTESEDLEKELPDEQVDEKASEFLSADITEGLLNSNWKERLAAVEKFTEIVKGMNKNDIPSQVFVRILSKKSGLKDTNFQVLKARLDLLTHLAENSKFSKTSANVCLPDLCDKIGDIKNGSSVMAVLTAISEATSLGYVNQQVIKYAFEQKNPKNQAETLNWLAVAIKEFGFQINVKTIIEYIKRALGATNPAVRTSAITLLGVIYMYMGPTLRVFFEDEKPALLQQIDGEFEKMQGVNPPPPCKGLVSIIKDGDEEDEEGERVLSGTTLNVADLIPRNDISGQITSSLISELSDKNWKVRGEALSKVANILSEAKFISSNLGDLPSALTARLADSNRNLATQALTICQTLGTSIGPNISKHVRTFGPGLFICLGDNKNSVRSTAIAVLHTWTDQCGLAPFIEGEMLSDALKLENPYIRSEVLGWLSEKLPSHKSLPSDLNLCIPLLLACLEDRNADVRKKAQDSLVPFMIHVGYDAMIRATSKLKKPASKVQVTTLLEKAKPNLPAKQNSIKKPVAVKGSNIFKDDTDKESNNGTAMTKPASNAGPKSKLKGAQSKTKLNMIGKTKSGKKEEEVDLTPILLAGSKEQRFADEYKLKVLKWNFAAPRDEFVDQLKDQMRCCFSSSLTVNMFHADFKYHNKALDTLTECVHTCREATIGALDLILKWLTLRFFETNPSVLLKGLEYLQTLFSALDNEDYHLHDLEASSFIPYLMLKAGDPKDAVRKDVKAILKLICKVYPASKMFTFVMDGLKNKNSRQRAECLDELGSLIENFGINVCQPNPATALKLIAQQISDRDNSVRNAALNTMLQAYTILGENVFKYVGNIADKDLALLEERIKRSAKSKPPVSVINPKTVQDEKSPRVTRIPSTAQIEPQKSGVNLRGAPKSAVRPSSGAFSLDLEKINVDQEHVEPLVLNLVEMDIDYIYTEPVKLPETRLRPPSPALKMLSNSPDASSALDLVITQVASNDINISVQALAQIDEFLKDEEKIDIMCNHVDQLLLAASLQIRMTYTKHMGDELTKKDDVIKLYRSLTTTLVALFSHRQLAKKASKDVLRDLVHNLITILLDNRLTKLEDGPRVVRSVNIMVVKIIEKADHTNIMSALIKLLQDCCANETCSVKFVELIMKCLWKIVRMIPNIINELNLDRILNDLHLFLKTFPSYTWKERSSDIPLRTIKTIIHTLAKLQGNKIMSHLSYIDNLQDSEIEPYLQKVLKKSSTSEQNNNAENILENRCSSREGKNSPRRLSKTTHDLLAEIFKKIGSKENTREGLSDLYDFKKRFPEADIEPFLRKSSQFFQNYIERGLKNIEMEKEGKLAVVSGQKQCISHSGSISNQTSDSDDTSPAIYRERLKALRAKCGLDNTGCEKTLIHRIQPVEPTGNIMALSKSVEENEFETTNSNTTLNSAPPPQIVADVDELRKRLERIKNVGKS